MKKGSNHTKKGTINSFSNRYMTGIINQLFHDKIIDKKQLIHIKSHIHKKDGRK